MGVTHLGTVWLVCDGLTGIQPLAFYLNARSSNFTTVIMFHNECTGYNSWDSAHFVMYCYHSDDYQSIWWYSGARVEAVC